MVTILPWHRRPSAHEDRGCQSESPSQAGQDKSRCFAPDETISNQHHQFKSNRHQIIRHWTRFNWTHHSLFLPQKSGGWVNFPFPLFVFSLLLLHRLQRVPTICYDYFYPKIGSLITPPQTLNQFWKPPVCWHKDGLCWQLSEAHCHKCSPLCLHPAAVSCLRWLSTLCFLFW